MRTVTFYSYKGGTGRTLLLANVAVLAARLGWKVVAIDVDLEAPGLTYKLFEEPPSRCDGLVGWLRDRFATGTPPLALGDSLLDVELIDPFEDGGWLKLMPAGRNPSLNYFQDLVGLRLEQRINEGPGVDAFVDLQEQVREELAPDLLLLDARTGISSTNLVTTRVLADDVIALTLDSREQLEGTRSVLRSLTPLTSLRTEEPIALHVILSRVAHRSVDVSSYAWTDAEREQVDRVRTLLREPADPIRATLTVDRIHLLHSEPSLIRGDFLTLARTRVLDATALHIDCLRIAEAILGDVVSERAARVIAETGDIEAREQLARFFARVEDVTAALGANLDQGDTPDAERPVALAERVGRLWTASEHDQSRRPDLAGALLDLADGLASVGQRVEAVTPTERAVKVYEELAASDPAFLNDLAMSLTKLGSSYSEAGRWADAVTPAERAVAIRERLAASDPAVLNDLAVSLTSLGVRYSEMGRHRDALEPAQRAVAIHEDVVVSDAAAITDLATSLHELGNRYREVGLPADALEPIERAIAIREELAPSNPAILEDLARSLTGLGSCYVELGRVEDAVVLGERALAISEDLAARSPAYLSLLATSLTNLAGNVGMVGRFADAVGLTERAIELGGGLAATNPAFLGTLAHALSNLAAGYGALGRLAEAIAPAERAVEIYEQLATSSPAFLDDLARALSNLGICYGEVGRLADALAPTERAVEISEKLAASNPAFVSDLASSLRWLGTLLSEISEDARAVEATERAAMLLRPLAAELPAVHNPILAATLRELAQRHNAVRSEREAQAAMREAERLYKQLLADP